MRTVIYTCGSGQYDGFHDWCEVHCKPMRLEEAWWFPEIKQIEHGAIPVHPREQIEMVPSMVGNRIVTMSEHIILAFQKLIRMERLEPKQVHLYCGNTRIKINDDGSLANWPGIFSYERLALLL